MFVSTLIFAYNIMVLLGLILSIGNTLRRVFPASPIPEWLRWLISFGLSGPIISLAGFIGIFRVPGTVIILGIILACYTIKRYAQLCAIFYAVWQHEAQALLFTILMLLITISGKWCYLQGGVNNPDEIRSVMLTVGFAANYLKPALPVNLSWPISYGYYLFEISAFLYSSIGGYLWPSIPILVINLTSIAFFYCTFVMITRAAFPKISNITGLVPLLVITFYGLSTTITSLFGIKYRVHPEFWHHYQFTTMIFYLYWTYHYLLGLAFVLGTLIALTQYCRKQHKHWLYAASTLVCFSLTFSTITGIWLLGLLVLCGIAATIYSRKYISTFLRHMLSCCPIIFVILIPQVFTFIGRDNFVEFTFPRAWFTRDFLSITPAAWSENIYILFIELGPLLFIGALFIPIYGIVAFRERNWLLAAIAGMAVIAVLGATFTSAKWYDWFWRGSNLFFPLSAAYGIIWLYETGRCRINVRLVHILLFIGISPCLLDFGRWVQGHINSCYPAPEMSGSINKAIDLHTVFQNHQPYSQQMVILGGRIYYENPPSGFISAYSNKISFLENSLGNHANPNACEPTLYGSALPSGLMVCSPDKGVFKFYTCQDINSDSMCNLSNHK